MKGLAEIFHYGNNAVTRQAGIAIRLKTCNLATKRLP